MTRHLLAHRLVIIWKNSVHTKSSFCKTYNNNNNNNNYHHLILLPLWLNYYGGIFYVVGLTHFCNQTDLLSLSFLLREVCSTARTGKRLSDAFTVHYKLKHEVSLYALLALEPVIRKVQATKGWN
jgi:hypothetical protein